MNDRGLSRVAILKYVINQAARLNNRQLLGNQYFGTNWLRSAYLGL